MDSGRNYSLDCFKVTLPPIKGQQEMEQHGCVEIKHLWVKPSHLWGSAQDLCESQGFTEFLYMLPGRIRRSMESWGNNLNDDNKDVQLILSDSEGNRPAYGLGKCETPFVEFGA